VPAFREGGDGAWVIGLIRDSPADYAGIRQGDLILEIGGRGLGQKSPFEVASLFQGEGADLDADGSDDDAGPFPSIGIENEWFGISKAVKKPPIQLRVRHLDGGEEQLDLQRPSVVPTPSPVSTKYDAKKRTGYIKLSSFNARAQRDVSAAVSNLVDAKGAETIVLDLRGNRGGLVSEGIEVAKVFLSKDDIIVRSRIKARQTESVVRATNEAPLTDAKLVVLVDGGTASASEIVAGALQDNCRAPLVGQNTYGKGLIQSVYELSDGSGLVLTVGKYVTPLGTDIDYSGLRPDFGGQPDDRQYDERIKACLVRKPKAGD
jgi:C-terminal peptidase prc